MCVKIYPLNKWTILYEKEWRSSRNIFDFQGSHHHKLAIATNLIQQFKTDWQ